MNRDDIIKLGREAGFRIGPSRSGPDDVWGVGATLERFAALVMAQEREACAEVCELMYDYGWLDAKRCAKEIRARGQG